jgi:phytoene dehydrogenase-like protein
MAEQEYEHAKEALIENALAALESLVPGIRGKVDYAEAATPTTFERYTRHTLGASFGTKFEGLECSRSLASHVGGLFHVGSTGIIMSGWLGAANYGVIAANEVDKYLAGSNC